MAPKSKKVLLVFPRQLEVLVTHDKQDSSIVGQSLKRKHSDGRESKLNHAQLEVDRHRSKQSSAESVVCYDQKFEKVIFCESETDSQIEDIIIYRRFSCRCRVDLSYSTKLSK